MSRPLRVLQAGFGAFGPVHLAGWRALGHEVDLWVADPDPAARAAARRLGVPEERLAADPLDLLEAVDAIDIAVPADHHFSLCGKALDRNLDVFIEKPMTATLAEAEALAGLLAKTDRILQVGFFLRATPLARALKREVEAGMLGTLRHAAGEFSGFKRPRRDSGVLDNDLVHFLDLALWLLGEPKEVRSLTRDFLGRGSEDLAVLLLAFPGGAVARLEASWHMPGDALDPIVPGNLATKRFRLAGAKGQLDADFIADRLVVHRRRHVEEPAGWRVEAGPGLLPPVTGAAPATVMAAQFEEFLACVRERRQPEAGLAAGLAAARLIERARRESLL
ncbi:Gfo/Idh/MocA family protein [Marinimicrococcus flavescens]|uniref:Gfo/Idh/MocA family oxidoreductase n=1 Tax=Marinimicrococcus flavescens TaxID=3031815 RepID=A0AAP3UZH9_9PROT|nr:Gfo/Idh/MocA family oxidoreductase [Marinimicrococcus flavescens]